MKLDRKDGAIKYTASHSARSAWIETLKLKQIGPLPIVALRKECVD